MNISNQVVNQSVLNLNGEVTGWANVTAPITGSSIHFPIYNSSNIEYSYAGNLTYFRGAEATNAVNLTTGNANWTLNAFSYAGPQYAAYQGNITGFNENHTTIQAFLGQNNVGFSRPPPYTTLIFNSAVDRITFLSTNYITHAEIPGEVHSNQEIDLNVTVGDVGTVNITICNGTASVYENGSGANGMTVFRWHVDTALTAGEYTFEATFFMQNQVGFFRQNFTLSRVAAIDTYRLVAIALDVLKFNFRLYDLYADSILDGATVNYNFANLTGSLQYGVTGNYTKTVDLGIFSVQPGTYALSLEAVKTGYQSILVSMPVEVVPRAIDFEITQPATNLLPGGFLEIRIVARDRLVGGNLLRPIDLIITIYRAGGNPDVDTIANGTLKSVSSTDTKILQIPTTAALGTYDIMIQVSGAYYSGNVVLNNALVIEEPLTTWVTPLLVVGVGMVGAGAFVQRKKVQSRRSVKGAIIMNPGGAPIAKRISPTFSTMDPHLISSALSGIVTMVNEMTGSSIRTIALEGRYLKIVLRDSFWLVLLMEKNPAWIPGMINKLVMDIEQRYGAEISTWNGEGSLKIPIEDMLNKTFGVEIEEAREPELEMAGGENQEIKKNDAAGHIPGM